ncbi:hypothetical protein [Bacillus sp. FJAT-29814]|uniref:hypothetical protein n=1 Tax=Bacillus sp. FJAT-29814 TaxID=1729688 RepID=UPI00082E8A86|nr:hypothetical protein [Bacillus sp. FJAT-29814]
MSKWMFLFILPFVLLLSACSGGTDESWENEEVTEASTRLLADDVVVLWKVDGSTIKLKIVQDDGKPIEKFDINHEKLLHLIIVSKDLSYFNHIHPEYKGAGLFEITNDFPSGGEYKLIADFKPADGGAMTKMEWVKVKGKQSETVPLVVDETLEKTMDGKKVTLKTEALGASKELTLKFTLLDAISGQPITDLEPYLGSIGHVVVMSEDGERYLHVHAVDGQGSGPEALFETNFPKSGVYKIWAQFQRDGEVFTVSYVVKVS